MPRANLDRMPMTISVELQETTDPALVERLTELINAVYVVAEDGLWVSGAQRTSAPQLTRLIEAGEIAVATLDGELAGAVRVHALADDAAEFGMLAAVPELRGRGVGRALIDFAEDRSRDRGLRAMRLELLVPLHWRHPSKEYLDRWYRRIGYRVVRTTTLDENYPELAPLLATPCELRIYEKPLE
jgi:GNAT superfamily N-acetyltransferase